MPRGKRRYAGITQEVFASVINKYLDSEKFKKLAPHTQRTYKTSLLLAEHRDSLGSVPIEEMRPALIQAFLDGLADRPAAQQKAQTAMKALERWAIVRDLLPREITTGTEAPGSDGGHTPWAEEQVAFAERSVSRHLSCAITLAANTGQRGSDIIRMRWTDIETVDGHPGINVVPQKLQGRLKLWIPFTQELITKMATWERRPGFILLKADGTPFGNRQQLTDAWLRERERPEMESLHGLVMHGLRGTAVVRLRRANVEIPLISDVVGMSEQMVKRYCRLSDQKQNALAAVYVLNNRNTTKKTSDFNGT
jgi:integrase